MRALAHALLLALAAATATAQRMPEPWFRARAALQANQPTGALVWADSALALAPRNPELWITRGQAHLMAGSYAQALADFHRAEGLRSGSASLWLARAHALQGDTPNALRELERHLRSADRAPEATIRLDPSFQAMSRSPEWQALWRTSWYTPQEELIASARFELSMGNWEHALDMLNQRLDGRRGHHRLFALRGEAYYMGGSFRAALADFTTAHRRSRRNHTYPGWKARALLALNRPAKALRMANRAIELSGGNPDYYLLRARAHAATQAYDHAANDVALYLSYYPQCLAATERFVEYAHRAHRYLDALLYLGRLISANPNHAQHLALRGAIYLRSQRWALAEPDLLRATQLDPTHGDAWLNLGIAQHGLGQRQQACASWAQARARGVFASQELLHRHCRTP